MFFVTGPSPNLPDIFISVVYLQLYDWLSYSVNINSTTVNYLVTEKSLLLKTMSMLAKVFKFIYMKQYVEFISDTVFYWPFIDHELDVKLF